MKLGNTLVSAFLFAVISLSLIVGIMKGFGWWDVIIIPVCCFLAILNLTIGVTSD